MMNTRTGILTAVAIAVLLLVGLAVGMNGDQASAAPLAAPTPISVTAGRPATLGVWLQESALTADANTSALNVAQNDKVDLQYVIDQAGINTVTLKLQFSNDNVNWADGATIVTSNTTDVNVMAQLATFGQYARVNADVTNANPVTITVNGTFK